MEVVACVVVRKCVVAGGADGYAVVVVLIRGVVCNGIIVRIIQVDSAVII